MTLPFIELRTLVAAEEIDVSFTPIGYREIPVTLTDLDILLTRETADPLELVELDFATARRGSPHAARPRLRQHRRAEAILAWTSTGSKEEFFAAIKRAQAGDKQTMADLRSFATTHAVGTSGPRHQLAGSRAPQPRPRSAPSSIARGSPSDLSKARDAVAAPPELDHNGIRERPRSSASQADSRALGSARGHEHARRPPWVGGRA